MVYITYIILYIYIKYIKYIHMMNVGDQGLDYCTICRGGGGITMVTLFFPLLWVATHMACITCFRVRQNRLCTRQVGGWVG